MTRSLPLAALALALAVAGSGCTKAKSSTPGARLRQPSSVATFQGVTFENAAVRPYLAIANAARNDVSIVDATTDAPVMAPIALRPVVLPIENRPSLLAAASLGDDDRTVTPPVLHADVLVAVAVGDNVVQLVETWSALNTVHSDPTVQNGVPVDPLVVSLPADVRALVPMASPAPGTARIAALLAGDRIAVLEYRRNGEAIQASGFTDGPALAFHAEAIAAMPGDPDHLYVATRDPLLPGDPGATPPVPPTFGVAEVSLAAPTAPPRVLGAVAPTRLVAAAQLQERQPASASSGTDAFDGQATVRRVYAVLDESACGPGKPIDCGVVTLDPTVTSGTVAIPADYSGLQRYRAPMRVPGRPLELAVSGPPAVPLGDVPDERSYPAGFMRVFMGTIPRATTAVAAVASDDGSVYFLDLGRFETEMNGSILAKRTDGSPTAQFGYPPQENPSAPVPAGESRRRLWIQNPSTLGFVVSAGTAESLAAVTTRPGFTPTESWSVRWEGTLLQLSLRPSEVAFAPGTSQLALAMQVSGGATPTQVVKLWHPALGVQKGDIVVIPVGGMPAGCAGTIPLVPPGTVLQQTRENEFEVRIGALLPPTDARPGGAVTLVRPDDTHPEWQACYDALHDVVAANATGTGVVSGLRATIRAGGLLLTGTTLGYLGRPPLGADYAVEYKGVTDEDALVTACPIADWDGSLPAPGSPLLSCDDTCRTACDQLVVARKARRLQNLSLTCDTDPSSTVACEDFWPGITPTSTGPALRFRVAVQPETENSSMAAFRDMLLTFQTQAGAAPLAAKGSSTAPFEASAAIPFDRTPWTGAADAYRFYVSYPADFVLDASPAASGPYTNVIK